MLQGHQCLFEAPYRLAVGRACLGFVPGLAAIHQRLLPRLAPQRMLRQPFHLVIPPVPRQGLKRLNDARRAARAVAPGAAPHTPPHG